MVKAKPSTRKPSVRSVGASATVEPVIGAKLGATARYSREHKTTLKGVIPEDVIREDASARRTLFSPLRALAGYVTDRIEQKREIARIYDHQVIEMVLQKAEERRKVPASAIVSPIPTKFAVHFLERASLEELGSPLVDLWANLLASASEQFEPYHLHFVDILSRLSSKQALLFQAMIQRSSSLYDLEITMERTGRWGDVRGLQETLELELTDKTWSKDRNEICNILKGTFTNPMIIFVYGDVSSSRDQTDFNYLEPSDYRDDQQVDYAILEANGVIRGVDTGLFKVNALMISAVYFYLTPLGFYLAKACKLLPEK
jgi:Abortive infection alpha